MAIAGILNALTTKSTIVTLITVADRAHEGFFVHTQTTPEDVRRTLSSAFVRIRQHHHPAPLRRAVPAGEELISRLERLSALHSAGALTDREFPPRKRRCSIRRHAAQLDQRLSLGRGRVCPGATETEFFAAAGEQFMTRGRTTPPQVVTAALAALHGANPTVQRRFLEILGRAVGRPSSGLPRTAGVSSASSLSMASCMPGVVLRTF